MPVLLCNNIPSLADLSHGMLRRLMVVPFNRRFTDQDRDLDLFERIWTRELPISMELLRDIRSAYGDDDVIRSSDLVAKLTPDRAPLGRVEAWPPSVAERAGWSAS